MRFQIRVPLGVVLCALLASGGLLAACGGGGGGGDASEDSEDLVLVEFSLVDQSGNPTGATGSTNAYRNNQLRFTFSEMLDPDSVSDRTIQIGIPSGTNLFLQAVGQYRVDGNRVTFDPSVTETGSPHPFGFEPDSVYSVLVKGHPETKTIVTQSGDSVVTSFTTNFTTTDLYLPDLDQPRAEATTPPGLDSNQIAELTQMTPEERVADNDATGRWENIWIDSRGDVIAEFSEAMRPATFDPASSFRVINMDRNNRDVLGVYKFSDDARTMTFRPTFGYGRGPYLIQVTMTVDITDLAGNPISNPQQWTFLSEYDPSAVNEGLIEEYFDDNVYEDTAFVPTGTGGRAHWNPNNDLGKLVATFGISSVNVPNPHSTGVSTNVIPLGTGSFANMFNLTWYKSSDCGNAGTITGFKFLSGTSSNAANAVMTNFIVKMGHNSLSGGLTSSNPRTANFNVGNPVTVINDVTYTLPTSVPNTTPIAYPQFTAGFGYNGTNHLTVDTSKTNSTGQQGWGVWSGYGSEVHRCYGYPASGTSASGTSASYYYQCVLDFRTETSMARSLWYMAESFDPIYLEALVSPTEQPPGTETLVEYQAAHDDGNGAPDPTTQTAWTPDITDLDSFQYLRFRASFKANLGTGVGPKLEEIVIPYIFF